MNLHKLRLRFLMRLHGLTEVQAQAVAALVWGSL
jgi:hypothetical protein